MGKCAGNIVVMITCILALSWMIIICLPTGWQTKATMIWNFHVGLYRVEVKAGLVGSALQAVGGIGDFTATRIRKKKTTWFKKAIKHVTTGEESLRYYRDLFCNVAVIPVMNMSCAPWEHLLIGSWVMLLSTIMTILLLLTGAAFMYYYVHHNTRAKVRKWAMGFLTAGPIVNMMGLAGYTGLTFQFGHWLAELMLSSAGATFSFIYVLALMLHLFTWAPVLIACTCAKAGEAEDIAEDMAWERKKLLYGFDDEYGYEEYDEYGNPRGVQYDEYGHPMQRTDEYGNPIHGSYHVSAYSEQEMGNPAYGQPYADPYAQPYADPYGAPAQGSYHESTQVAYGSYHEPPQQAEVKVAGYSQGHGEPSSGFQPVGPQFTQPAQPSAPPPSSQYGAYQQY